MAEPAANQLVEVDVPAARNITEPKSPREIDFAAEEADRSGSDSGKEDSNKDEKPNAPASRLDRRRRPAKMPKKSPNWRYDLNFTGPFRFLDLPLEVRRKIYRHAFRAFPHLSPHGHEIGSSLDHCS